MNFFFFLYDFRHRFRYEAVLLRARIDETRKEKDMRKLAAMLEEGELECQEAENPDPFIFRDDEGGITYNRENHYRDSLLDHWHPWEKVR